MKNIFEMCDEWAAKTYGDVLESDYRDDVYYERYKKVLLMLGLYYKKMLGNSVQRLPWFREAEGRAPFTFAHIFYSLIIQEKGNVCDYVIDVMRKCIELGKDEEFICGYTARSLRSFPSFLREIQLKAMFNEVLEATGEDFYIVNNPDTDIKEHADLVLNYKNSKHYIWSYQNTAKGLKNTRQKLLGVRDGVLSRGVNVLCPFDFHKEDSYNEWGLYSRDTVRGYINLINQGNAEPYNVFYTRLKQEPYNGEYTNYDCKNSCMSKARMLLID